MRKSSIFFTAALLGLLSTAPCLGQESTSQPPQMRDSIESAPVYFPVGGTALDKNYMDNTRALGGLDSILTDRAILSDLDTVRVIGLASPEGRTTLNQRLAAQRTTALANYILANYPTIDRNRVVGTWSVASWGSLRSRIAADASMPSRSQVLEVIDQATMPSTVQSQLQGIDNGRAWSYLSDNYLKQMRYDRVVVTYGSRRQPVEPAPQPAPVAVAPVQTVIDTVKVVEQVTVYNIVTVPEPAVERKPLFALKTNLLFDLATALNIEIEVPIGQRWSIAGEYIFPWWLWKRHQICFETLSGSIEGRYWFGDRTLRPQLTGWFMGLYVGGGYYDVEWKKTGYQGEFIAPGISAGYAHKIGRNLSMEYSLGIGVIRTKYRKYEAVEDAGCWCLQETDRGHGTWIGPTKVKVSLVWMINKTRKK